MRDYNKHRAVRKPSQVFAVLIGFAQIFRAPITSLFFILVFSFSLFLIIMSYLFWSNSNKLDEKWNESVEIAMYLKRNVGSNEANSLAERLRSDPSVAKVDLIEQDEGMKSFIESTMLDTLLSSFKKNPLPNVIVVQPKVRVMSEKATLGFVEELESYSEVETIKLDLDWIVWSYDLLNLVGGLSLALVLVLGINALLLICGMSYALSQLFIAVCNTRKNVLQFQFAWYGLLSGLLALFFASLVLSILKNHGIFLSGFRLGGWFVVVFMGIFLSFFSSRFAIQLYNHKVH